MSAQSELPSNQRRPLIQSAGLIGAVFVLVAVVAYGGWWWFVAQEFQAGIERWQADVGKRGVAATWSSLTVDGFPDRVVATISDPAISTPEGHAWRTDEIRLGILPWSLGAITIDAPGTHDLTFPSSSGSEQWSLSANSLSGSATGDAGGGTVNLSIQDGLIREGEEEVSKLQRLAATLNRPAIKDADPGALNPPVTYDVAITATHEDLRNTINWPFDDKTQQSDIRALLHGDMMLPINRRRLVDWRDQGGSLELRGFSTRIGPLRLVGDGTVSIDRALQPTGAMAFSVTGYDVILDMLVRDGQVPAKNATMIRGLLDLLAKRGGSGDGKTIDASLSVQESRLYLGPFEIARIPQVVWPQ